MDKPDENILEKEQLSLETVAQMVLKIKAHMAHRARRL